MIQRGVVTNSGLLRRWLIVFVTLLLLFYVITPNVSYASGLAEIYQYAQKNDPTINGAYFQQMAIKEGRKQAVAQMFPTLAGSAAYTNTEQDIKSSDNTVFGVGSTDYDTTSYSLTLTQPVFHWDSIVGLKQSKAESRRAEVEYILARQELIVRVVDLYLRALATQDQLDFALAEQIAVAKHLELASGRQQMGLIPITDLYDAKARMSTTQARTIDAQNQRDDARQALQEVTDIPVEELQRLQTEMPLLSPEPADINSWIEQGLQQNPAIELHRQTVAVANQEVRRQQAGHYPTLDLIGRYNSEETDGTLFGGGSEVDTTDIMLQLNVPLYQGGLINSRVRQASHQLSIARQDFTKQQRAVKRQVRAAYLGVKSALSRVAALQQSVAANQLALEAKQEGFLSGLYTSLYVLDAERDLSLAGLDYAQARYDYILNGLQLKHAVGMLNEQNLLELDQWFK